MNDLNPLVISEDLAEEIIAHAEEIALTVETPGWKLIMRKFRLEAEAAMEALRTVEPTDTKTVTSLQNRANRYYEFEQTATELLQQAATITAQAEFAEDGDAIDD